MARKKSALILSCCLVFAACAGAADHFVTYQNGTDKMLMPCNLWYAGCAPTAASMVLGYWDNYGLMGGGGYGKYQDWGKLQQYYMDHAAAQEKQAYSGGYFWGGDTDGIPALNYDLAYNMHTDTEGSTFYMMIGPGIRDTANSRGYPGEWSNSYMSYISPEMLWTRVVGEIDAGRPLVWSASSSDSGHSIACWGYTDSKYVIVYNTWDEMRHDYYYTYYTGVTGIPAVYLQIDTVEPGPGTGSDIRLISPAGGEMWYRDTFQDISWFQWGTGINVVKIYYSVDGGETWQFGAEAPGAEGNNVFSWHVPDSALSSRVKLKVEGYSGEIYIAADGSKNNFFCTAATHTVSPTITATHTITPTWTVSQTHTISPTFTVSPTNTPTPDKTPVFCLDFIGVFPNPVADPARLEYALCRNAEVYLYLYNISGELVRKMRKDGVIGNNSIYWDCASSSGKKVPRGMYIFVIEAVSGSESGRKTGKLAVK